jgi:phage tail sheath gpL-like
MGISAAQVARVLGITTAFASLRQGATFTLPQRIAVVAQGATSATYAATKRQVTSALEAAGIYGFGSPIHLICMMLFPVNGDGVGSIPVTIYPLSDHASGVAATGSFTPTGTSTTAASLRVRVGGILSEAFTLAVGATPADAVAAITTAISAVLEMPALAVDNASTSCDLTAKWEGTSGNDIALEVIGTPGDGMTIAVTAMNGGLTNPDVTTALDQVGDVWETMLINGLSISDTVALDAFSTWGEGRWGTITHKPAVVFTGNTESDRATATAGTTARNTDRTNVQLVAPGSKSLPFMVAARQLARIVVQAQDNPPTDYGAKRVTGILPGTDGEQWDSTARDAAVKAGSSTVSVRDGEVRLEDIVTMYAPTGDPSPAYRFVVDIVKLQQVIYNLSLIFASEEWAGAPLIPDEQPTRNSNARKPKHARTAVNNMIESLALDAILAAPKAAKKRTTTAIDSENAKRMNTKVVVALSGNTNVKDVELDFGFFYGTQAAA